MKLSAVVFVLALVVAAEALAVSAENTSNRKLAQWRNRNRDRDRNSADAQFARNQAAAINTQQAIRAAEESGAAPGAVRGATNVGSANAWLAAQRSDWVFGPSSFGKKKM